MKIYCCGVKYSTDDPETYWCITEYRMTHPSLNIIGGKKVEKEVVYTLHCKKNGCLKLEIQRYYNDKGVLKILETRILKGIKAQKFLESTKNMRIRQPQCCPIQKVQSSKNIPWVYGKPIDKDKQVARYIDESGNRQIFKNNIWKTEIMKSTVNTFNSLI